MLVQSVNAASSGTDGARGHAMHSWSKWFRDRRDFVILTAVAVFVALLGAMPDINPGGAEAYFVSWVFVLALALMTLLAIRQMRWGIIWLMMAFTLYMVLLGGTDFIPFQSHQVWLYALIALGTIFFYETARPGGLWDASDEPDEVLVAAIGRHGFQA